MFTFRKMVDDAERIGRRVRRTLESRSAISIGELCLRLSMYSTAVVRAELEAMVSRGEVERLRPVGYALDNYDFFRLTGRPAVAVVRAGWPAARQWRDLWSKGGHGDAGVHGPDGGLT